MLEQQVADLLRFAPFRRIENHIHIRAAAAFMNLPHHRSLKRSLHRFQNFDGAKTKLSQPVTPQLHRHPRRARRCSDLRVFAAGYRLQHTDNFLRLVVNHIQIVAINIHHHRRGFAGDGFADAVAQECYALRLDARKAVQQITQVVHQFGLHAARECSASIRREIRIGSAPRCPRPVPRARPAFPPYPPPPSP